MGSADSHLSGSPIARPLIDYVNRVVSSVDMAELGMAFGFGTPAVIYHADMNAIMGGMVHPIIRALTGFSDIARTPESLAASCRRMAALRESKGANTALSMAAATTEAFGRKWLNRLGPRAQPAMPP